MAEFMSMETDMLRKTMVCQDFIQIERIRIVSLHVDVKVSSEGGVLEGTSKGKMILKIFEELANGKVWGAIKTDKVKFNLEEVYRGNDVFK